MRADRLLRLLMLLQRHRRLTASWLAEELEVSERTVLRDMEALSAAGVPVFTERGRGGGCVLLEGFTTQASGLTPTEAQALFAWASRETVTELGLGGDLASGLAKIAATAPESSVRRAEELGEVVLADRRRWFAAAEQVPLLPVLRDAVTAGRRIRVRYMSATEAEPSVRTLDPIGLVDQSGRWYLVAEHRHRAKTYRVSRLSEVQVLDEPAALVDRRSLAEVWTDLRGRLEGKTGDPIEVLVAVDLGDPERVGNLRRLITMQLAPGSRIVAEPGSSDAEVHWRATLRQPPVMAAVAVLFAPHATILEPPWLRDHVREAAARTLAHYAGGPDQAMAGRTGQ